MHSHRSKRRRTGETGIGSLGVKVGESLFGVKVGGRNVHCNFNEARDPNSV